MLTFFAAPEQVTWTTGLTSESATTPPGTFVPLSYSITEAAFGAQQSCITNTFLMAEKAGEVKSPRPDWGTRGDGLPIRLRCFTMA